MGRKPKAGNAKGKTTNPAQSARFIEAARRAGVDETGEAFERAFEKIAPPKHPAAHGERDSGKSARRRPA